MFRSNCAGKPIFDERFREAINNWAAAKGVDPERVFTANDWDMSEGNKRMFNNPNPPSDIKVIGLLDNEGFKIKPGQQINTSVFEEAIIAE